MLHVTRLRGGISGGTIDSLRQQAIETSGDPIARRLTTNPWALVDEVAGRGYGSSGSGPQRPTRNDRTGSWQAPFVMGAYNGQIVHRSNALAELAVRS